MIFLRNPTGVTMNVVDISEACMKKYLMRKCHGDIHRGVAGEDVAKRCSAASPATTQLDERAHGYNGNQTYSIKGDAGHEPLTINNRLINKVFVYIL